MELDNFRKLLAYLVVMCLLIAHPCSSYPDVTPPPIASDLEAVTNLISYSAVPSQSQVICRHIVGASLAPSPSPCMAPNFSPQTAASAMPTLSSETQYSSPPAPLSIPSQYHVLDRRMLGGNITVPSPSPSETPPSPMTQTSIIPTPSSSPNSSSASPTNETTTVMRPTGPPSNQQTDTQATSKAKTTLVAVVVAVVLGVILCTTCLFGLFLLRRRRNQKNDTEGVSPSSEAPIFGFGNSDVPLFGLESSEARKYKFASGLDGFGAGAGNGSSGSDGSHSNPLSGGFTRKLQKRYSFHTLAKATSGFNDKNKLGEGGFGPVFKGILEDEEREVAVKRVSKGAKGAPKQYKAEVKILTRLSHRNLVELFGWCEEEGELLLVYKFMPNGSLNSQLYNSSRLLTWAERYNIVLGLAFALNYLHEECEECVLHRDIKPGNVLLDSSFNAKLSDFGLARLVDHELDAKITTLAGTLGYLAPEYVQESIPRKESDIYSFGVVLLEIACGRSPLAGNADNPGVVPMLIDLVWNHYGKKEMLKIADKRLNGAYITEQMECVMTVGLWCAHPFYEERPTIGEAIRVLKCDAALPELPPNKPVPLRPLISDLRLLSRDASSSGF